MRIEDEVFVSMYNSSDIYILDVEDDGKCFLNNVNLA